MSVQPLLFWVFAATAIVGGLMAVLLPSIVRAVFALMLSFVGIAAVYVLAGADFLAILQIVVYVGGITVLFAFGILLTGRTAATLGDHEIKNRKTGLVVGFLIFGGLMAALSKSSGFKIAEADPPEGTIRGLGELLLTDYLVAFEFASVLLLVALVGAAYLVRREKA